MDKKITCANCKHYHFSIIDQNSFWHIHDFCDFWMKTIPNKCDNDDIYTDVESGKAYCWAFKEND